LDRCEQPSRPSEPLSPPAAQGQTPAQTQPTPGTDELNPVSMSCQVQLAWPDRDAARRFATIKNLSLGRRFIGTQWSVVDFCLPVLAQVHRIDRILPCQCWGHVIAFCALGKRTTVRVPRRNPTEFWTCATRRGRQTNKKLNAVGKCVGFLGGQGDTRTHLLRATDQVVQSRVLGSI
jgi:hypothetical protein